MKERLLILLATALLVIAGLQPIWNGLAAATPAPRTAENYLWPADHAPDADCQNGGQCSN